MRLASQLPEFVAKVQEHPSLSDLGSSDQKVAIGEFVLWVILMVDMVLSGNPMILINSQVKVGFRVLLQLLFLVHHIVITLGLEEVNTMMLGSFSSGMSRLHQT